MNLNKLLKSLKSEKSSIHEPVAQNKAESESYEYKMEEKSLWSECPKYQVKCGLDKIRYWVLDGLPPLMNRVRACGISVFNQLPFSGRKVKEIDLHKQPFPEYLSFLKPLLQHEIPTYNHILINDYPHNIGIMPHFDGPLYKPKVFVLSLNSYAIIRFHHPQTHQKIQLLLQPNSIHIFENQPYTQYLHGIQNYTYDSIALHFDPTSRTITDVTIENYPQLHCRAQIEEILGDWPPECQIVQKPPLTLFKLNANPTYNYKIQFLRSARISITIRQKYTE